MSAFIHDKDNTIGRHYYINDDTRLIVLKDEYYQLFKTFIGNEWHLDDAFYVESEANYTEEELKELDENN